MRHSHESTWSAATWSNAKLTDPMGLVRSLADSTFSRDPVRRNTARFRVLDTVAQRLGFKLYNWGLTWKNDEEYLRVWREFQPGAREIKDRKFVLFSMARSVADLPGDTAECGVYEGGSSYLICAATGSSGGRLHHVFDSFEGLSEPEEDDAPTDDRAFRWKSKDLAVPLETVQANLARFPHVRFHKGWIPDRFSEVADRAFCFVHVDVDLLQPTRDSLEFFYDRLTPGGILLCDDYGFTTCPGARRAFDEFVADKPEKSVVHLSTGQGFVTKR